MSAQVQEKPCKKTCATYANTCNFACMT